MFRRRKQARDDGGGGSSPEDVYRGLRALALQAVDDGVLSAPPAEHADVGGVVVDIPRSGAVATLVGLTDNTTSLYTTRGGGIIGAGEHRTVALATHALLTSVQQHLDAFTAEDDAAPPPAGSVRFHVLTATGRRSSDVPDGAFWGEVDHPLMPVISAAQDVISVMQTVTPDSTP